MRWRTKTRRQVRDKGPNFIVPAAVESFDRCKAADPARRSAAFDEDNEVDRLGNEPPWNDGYRLLDELLEPVER